MLIKSFKPPHHIVCHPYSHYSLLPPQFNLFFPFPNFLLLYFPLSFFPQLTYPFLYFHSPALIPLSYFSFIIICPTSPYIDSLPSLISLNFYSFPLLYTPSFPLTFLICHHFPYFLSFISTNSPYSLSPSFLNFNLIFNFLILI